jgi:phosphoenolpyruvate phosphomutase
MTKTDTKAKKLRGLIEGPDLSFLMECHNGLSAKIAEEAGFAGLWGSGLSISASLALRDNNELSWTQVLHMAEYISDATTIPLLLDGDTGYGNFNNMRRLVKKLEQIEVAGVCIEDKLFPKTNSFIDGDKQPLADADEFCGKIKAGKDEQRNDDFVIVARVEALIAGWGLREALRRAEAYRLAGADAILMHSKKSTADEILAFMKEWGGRCPVVIVPTKYYSVPTDVFRAAGVRTVIWANHLMRASLTAMRQTAEQIHREQTLVNVEDRIAPLTEVFRIQGDEELQDAEKRYLPARAEPATAVVLAASRGAELGALTADKPKALLDIGGKTLLERIVDSFQGGGVKGVVVVRGYKKELFKDPGLRYADNDDYEATREVHSLRLGLRGVTGPVLMSFGDVLCHKYIPRQLVESDADFCIAVDARWKESRNKGRYADFVKCDQPYSKVDFGRPVHLKEMSSELKDGIHGEWLGLMKISADGVKALEAVLAPLDGQVAKMRMAELLNRLITAGKKVRVLYVQGDWFDVDEVQDLVDAGAYGGFK